MARYEAFVSSPPISPVEPEDAVDAVTDPLPKVVGIPVTELWPDEKGELCMQFLRIMHEVNSPDALPARVKIEPGITPRGSTDRTVKGFIIGGHGEPHIKSYEAHLAGSIPGIKYKPLRLPIISHLPIMLCTDGRIRYSSGEALRTLEFVVGTLLDGQAVGPIYEPETYTAWAETRTLQLKDYGGMDEVTRPATPYQATRQVQVRYDSSINPSSYKRIMPVPLDHLLFRYTKNAGV